MKELKEKLYNLALNLKDRDTLSILVSGNKDSFHLSIISFPSHVGNAFYIDDTTESDTIKELTNTLEMLKK